MSTTGEFAPIVGEVHRQLRGRLRQFNINRHEEGIILSGEAPTYYVKQLAQHAVSQITPLSIVRNEISVSSRDSGPGRVSLQNRRRLTSAVRHAAWEKTL